MKKILCFVLVCSLVMVFAGIARSEDKASGGGSVALGPVDVGQFSVAGDKPADVSETIQFMMKKELEGKGIGPISTVSASSAAAEMPEMPTDRAPTQKEMNAYMKAMKQMTGQERAFKAVSADNYFEFKIRTERKHASTAEVTNTIGAFAGVNLSPARMSSDNTTVYLVCDQRDSRTGDLIDRFTAESTSVDLQEVGGYYQYSGGGDNYMKLQKLFQRSVKKCAGWMEKKLK